MQNQNQQATMMNMVYLTMMTGGVLTHNEPGQLISNYIVYKLNLKSSKWEHFSQLKSERVGHQSTIIGNKMYSVGGFNFNTDTCLADTEILPISKTDKTLHPTIPTMHNERYLFGMCSFAGCNFVAGGQNNTNGILDKCEIYSTDSCKWVEASSLYTKVVGLI